jgi:hypothetical protein
MKSFEESNKFIRSEAGANVTKEGKIVSHCSRPLSLCPLGLFLRQPHTHLGTSDSELLERTKRDTQAEVDELVNATAPSVTLRGQRLLAVSAVVSLCGWLIRP